MSFILAFHFDPVIYYENWERDYEELINLLFDNIKAEHIRWISLGTLRFSRELKKIIENRFPQNHILNEELSPGFDGKMRYREKIRIDVYKKMNSWIKRRSKRVFVYLCMENRPVWKECSIPTAQSIHRISIK